MFGEIKMFILARAAVKVEN